MEILSILPEAFRNLDAGRLEFGPGLNLVAGENGQGKTNLLEAIAIVSGRSSFRGAEFAALRRDGAERCRVLARLTQGAAAEGHLAVVLSEGSREHFWDARKVTRLEAATRLPAVFLTGADLTRLSGPPSERRRCVDRVAAFLDPAHTANLRRYEKARASKARLLALDRVDRDELAGFDALMADAGAHLYLARAQAASRLEAELRHQAERLGSPYRDLELLYVTDTPAGVDARPADAGAAGMVRPGGSRDGAFGAGASVLESRRAALLRRLAGRGPEERRAGRCLVGPHRDDLRLTSRGQPLAERVSSGERRTLVLAWTLAEIHVVASALGTSPVFAFDDFDSEWDGGVLSAFAASLPSGMQTFLTSARPEAVRGLRFAEGRQPAHFTMTQGRLRRESRPGHARLAVAS